MLGTIPGSASGRIKPTWRCPQAYGLAVGTDGSVGKRVMKKKRGFGGANKLVWKSDLGWLKKYCLNRSVEYLKNVKRRSSLKLPALSKYVTF